MLLKKFRDNPIIETLFFAAYFCVKKICCKDARNNKKIIHIDQHRRKKKSIRLLREYHIAIISDELTYENFSKECQLHVLTPNNWQQVFQKYEIDLFFCESTWNGCKANKRCWRGRIYKNHKVLFETRKTLFNILEYCNQNNIPTAFWNKEDPTYFGNLRYDFVDTALRFQYIFTTAEECIEKYHRMGHEHVNCMMFGFSPELYNPKQDGPKQYRAVFAGSWFGNDTLRCQAEEALFTKVLTQKIPLIIYDRQSENSRKDWRFPQKFQQYVRPAVSQKILGKEIKASQYAININTVTDSETMFARRVYELMASNVYVISNSSKAMERQLNGRYSAIEDEIPTEVQKICRENVDYVFANHTNEIRLQTMLRQMGFVVKNKDISIAICCMKGVNKKHISFAELRCEFIENLQLVTNQYQYFILWDGTTDIAIQQMVSHYRYLDLVCGIRINSNKLYQIVEDTMNVNVLFPIEMLEQLQTNINTKLKKYHI